MTILRVLVSLVSRPKQDQESSPSLIEFFKLYLQGYMNLSHNHYCPSGVDVYNYATLKSMIKFQQMQYLHINYDKPNIHPIYIILIQMHKIKQIRLHGVVSNQYFRLNYKCIALL